MSAPDPERTARPAAQGKGSAFRTDRQWIGKAFFLLTLSAVLYFALMPYHGHTKILIVPLPVFRWIAEHDDFDNIMAFAVLAMATFLLGRPPAARKGGIGAAFARRFASRMARLAGLLAMVCVFEILQIWIPGRNSALRDVCTGWSGIFAAWLLCELRDARQKKSGPPASDTD